MPTLSNPAVTRSGTMSSAIFVKLSWQHQRHRPGPERLGQALSLLIEVSQLFRLHSIKHMDDQRVKTWALFCFEDLGDRRFVEGVGSQTVYRLGRHADEFTLAQQGSRLFNRRRLIPRQDVRVLIHRVVQSHGPTLITTRIVCDWSGSSSTVLGVILPDSTHSMPGHSSSPKSDMF